MLTREMLSPESRDEWLKMRRLDITSTDCAAMFGLSPYKTPLQLWLKLHTDLDDSIEETERMRWGTRLESAIAHGIAEDRGWRIEKWNYYQRIVDHRLGSSFDFMVMGDRPAILEIKNVGLHQFSSWVETASGLEAPLHIEMQVQHQMLVAGVDLAYIGVLVGGNQVHVIEREADMEIQEQILAKAKEFWSMTERPPADYAKDAQAIIRLNQFAEPGTVLQATDDIDGLAKEYLRLGSEIRALETAQEIAKARLVEYAGVAEKVKGNGYSITMNMVGPATVSYERKGYRQFRINTPRAEK